MKRIFLTLAIVGNLTGLATFALGWLIEDPRVIDPSVQAQVSSHMLCGLAALVLQALVHAIVLTYFMGTGRWMEETTRAYHLDEALLSENQSLKYQTLPGMISCLLLLTITAALGAAVDPASPVEFSMAGIPGATIHFVVAALALLVNFVTNCNEYSAVAHNSEIVDQVMAEVRRIRIARGLAV